MTNKKPFLKQKRQPSRPLIRKERYCYFCKNNLEEVDWQDIETLRHYLSPYKKIKSRFRSGLCAKHQRKIEKAIKKARQMGLIEPA